MSLTELLSSTRTKVSRI